jgi:hypothetical protein
VWRKLHDWVMELEMAHLRNQAAHDCIGAQLEEAAATYSQASDMFERTKVTPIPGTPTSGKNFASSPASP